MSSENIPVTPQEDEAFKFAEQLNRWRSTGYSAAGFVAVKETVEAGWDINGNYIVR